MIVFFRQKCIVENTYSIEARHEAHALELLREEGRQLDVEFHESTELYEIGKPEITYTEEA